MRNFILGCDDVFSYFSNRLSFGMEIRVDIAFDQLLATIRKLPASKLMQLRSELDSQKIGRKAEDELSDFQNFLLSGPVMADDQYKQHKENRANFNAWRK